MKSVKLEGRDILNAAARIVEMSAICDEEEAVDSYAEIQFDPNEQSREDELVVIDQLHGRAKELRELASQIRGLDINGKA